MIDTGNHATEPSDRALRSHLLRLSPCGVHIYMCCGTAL